MTELIVARTAGYCFGVRRAVKLAFEAPADAYCTLGPIIHNRKVVERLAERGIYPVERLEELPEGRGLILRSHGVGPEIYAALTERGIPYLDATCPDVRRIHHIVRAESEAGRTVVIIGDPEHPEVRAMADWCDAPLVFAGPGPLGRFLGENPQWKDVPLSVVSQTTNTAEVFKNYCEKIKKECTNVKIFDTICGATCKRQTEAAELARRCDLMVVVGDRGSSNTKKLFDICSANCGEVIFAEDGGDIDSGRLRNARIVGITAGASAPDWIIKEVLDKMSDEIKNMVAEATEESAVPAEAVEEAAVAVETPVEAKEAEVAEEEDFATMLESAIKTLNTGDKVIGVVTAITPTEVYVDLGTKHAGYIPMDQISDDPTVKAEDLFKIGDEVECYTVRVNDVEGTAQLSKKRLDAVKNWDMIEQACEDKTTVEGIVTEENKGGVVVMVKGVRVFVPASQTGVPRDKPMDEIMKKTVPLRITEFNRARRRVVGSIRAVAYEARRAAADKIWGEIEVGKVYHGTVKSLTSYGAFVDIGGIDGMVHVSELSWGRIRNPGDVVKVGQEVDVNVISFDPEKKKISLGYLNKGENPWTVFTSQYEIGSVLDAKIVKLMPFGAFAEILPGVDGLIHISQIADRRIATPGEVLTEGETVRVKITDIDNDKQKISLSIRALLNEEPIEE